MIETDSPFTPAEHALEAPRLARAAAADVLAWVQRRFGARAAIAASFSAEDVVLIHLAAEHAPGVRIFMLDTGRLPEETHACAEAVRRRYGKDIELFFPDAAEVERLTREKGLYSFRAGLAERVECCAIRKTAPLARALTGRQAWITGLRREQAVTRAAVEVLEFDAERGLAKVNPLAHWTEDEVHAFVAAHDLPHHALYAKGYRSIGCAPCTRAVAPGEDARAGRWWWEQPLHRECGLHVPRAAQAGRRA